mmetsp:Transcript_10478/g.29897  ORF Transcript_10478/g.29897 Transcript_10478/m.29897 type:complete len:211 (+) Transcript_10478:844-1476(+)
MPLCRSTLHRRTWKRKAPAMMMAPKSDNATAQSGKLNDPRPHEAGSSGAACLVAALSPRAAATLGAGAVHGADASPGDRVPTTVASAPGRVCASPSAGRAPSGLDAGMASTAMATPPTHSKRYCWIAIFVTIAVMRASTTSRATTTNMSGIFEFNITPTNVPNKDGGTKSLHTFTSTVESTPRTNFLWTLTPSEATEPKKTMAFDIGTAS